MTDPQKRVRKKADLRVHIPSYASDYVPMPPQVRQRYLESTGTPTETPYTYYETEGPLRAMFQIGSPVSNKSLEETRLSSPAVGITDPKDEAKPEGNIINYDIEGPVRANSQIGSPAKLNISGEIRPSTPVVRIIDPKEEIVANEIKPEVGEVDKHITGVQPTAKDKTNTKEEGTKVGEVIRSQGKGALDKTLEEEDVVLRNPLRRSSISVPDGLRDFENLINHYDKLLDVSAENSILALQLLCSFV